MRIHDAVNEAQTAPEIFMNAVVAQVARSGNLPYILSYAPVASMNPFQRLLYSRAEKSNFAIVPTVRFSDLGRVNWRGRSIIHLHWLASILNGATTANDASVRIENFRQKLHQWKVTGHKVLWTMHNLLPHDSQFVDYEIVLRKILIDHTDAIHILSKQSVYESSRFFDIPVEKTFYIPHPSYEGWYPNVVDPVSARLDLGISPGEFVFLQFGSLQRYKGTIGLIHAFNELKQSVRDKSLRLVIVGKPTDKDYLSEIQGLAEASINVTVIPSAMEDRDLQILFNACDVVVAPYVATLNSGIALLAATFGKALVAPNISGISEVFSEDSKLLYDIKDSGGLKSSMLKSLDFEFDNRRLRKTMILRHPERISIEFFKSVKKSIFHK